MVGTPRRVLEDNIGQDKTASPSDDLRRHRILKESRVAGRFEALRQPGVEHVLATPARRPRTGQTDLRIVREFRERKGRLTTARRRRRLPQTQASHAQTDDSEGRHRHLAAKMRRK